MDYDTTAELNEQIWLERIDADREQAALEAEGNRLAKLMREVEYLLKAERIDEAVAICPHGYVGGLTGSCTDGDERHGQDGYRCFECGAHVTDLGGEVLNVR